jgi:hypothetical protein
MLQACAQAVDLKVGHHFGWLTPTQTFVFQIIKTTGDGSS